MRTIPIHRTPRLVAWMAFLLFLCPMGCWAAGTVADGWAPYDPTDVESARRLATQDARQQAAAEAGVEVFSTTTSGNPQDDTTTMHTTGVVSNSTTISEQVEGELYHVRVAANTAPDSTLSYRKKIALTRFSVLHPEQVPDISALPEGYPEEILHRLENSHRFLVRDATQYSVLDGDGPLSLKRENRDVVHRVAALTDAQFVIAGVILDAGSTPPKGLQEWVPPGVVPGFGESTRQIEVEVYLYDGINGNLLSVYRHVATAHGQVSLDRAIPFASKRFFGTDFGKTVENVIASQVQDLTKAIECLPFIARIVHTEGDRIFIDAGATSLLRPGDVLSASRLEPMLPILEMDSTATLGNVEKYAGTVTIAQVQPLFSIARIDHKEVRLSTGDYVHFKDPAN